jgi:surfeit locus 1 family protein
VRYRFRPKLIPTLATLLLLPLLVHLGFWQYGKAQTKLALQRCYDAAEAQPPLPIGTRFPAAEELRYRRVALTGQYEPRYQFLLDNQVQKEVVGYHVITPLHVVGSETRVLVDRGWVPLGRDRSQLPPVDAPAGIVTVSGAVWLPPARVFTLGGQAAGGGWQTVWENVDLARYRAAVPFPVQAFLVRLDPAATGGFVREWPRPDARVATNLGYAFQWFGMAAALVAIYLVVNLKREGGGHGAD